MTDADLKILLLGALLHDIGKFRMRALGAAPGNDHSHVGEEWLRTFQDRKLLPEGVATLTGWHHYKYMEDVQKSNATLIIYEADNLAAHSEREEKEKATYHPEEVPLSAILSTITGENQKRPPRYYFPLQPLTGRLIFPGELKSVKTNRTQYRVLWDTFEKEFEKWCKAGCHIPGLLVLLERYCSFIPSETLWQEAQAETHPDISLFDHMKTTAAVANCLYLQLKEKNDAPLAAPPMASEIRDRKQPYYLLVGGDLSGVQNFIYTISSRGALKTLRARSFFLELLSEHLVTQFLELAGLSRANVIYCGGGRFNMIAANTAKTQEALQRIKTNCNAWLMEQFNGRLNLVIGCTPFNGDEFSTSRIAEIWKGLGEEIAANKHHKYDLFLDRLLKPRDPLLPETICQICHRDDVESVSGHGIRGLAAVCPFCAQLYRLGERLPGIKALAFQPAGMIKGDYIGMVDCIEQRKMGFLVLEEIPTLCEEPLYVLNSLDISSLPLPKLVPMAVSRYARRNRDLPKPPLDPDAAGYALASFEDLANQALGQSRLGVLRMDVDHLGRIFQAGLPETKRTFTRLSAISRQLTLFFKVYLDQLLAGEVHGDFQLQDISEKSPEKCGRNVTVVYSGGDDLFIVGAWDEIAEVALDIHAAFQRFSGFNPNVTISGGFVIQRHDFPLYRLAELAGDAEKASKDAGRNAMTFFFDPGLLSLRYHMSNRIPMTFKWEQVPPLVLGPLYEMKALGAIKKNAFQSALLTKSDIGRLFLVLEKWEAEGVLYLPQLAYILGRMKKELRETPFGQKLLSQDYIKNWRTALLWIMLISHRNN